MEHTHHIVVEHPNFGFREVRVYLATLDELSARGWSPAPDFIDNFELTGYVHEDDAAFGEEMREWDAKGKDAWVSVRAYPEEKVLKTADKLRGLPLS
jgi:hypothetical protein